MMNDAEYFKKVVWPVILGHEGGYVNDPRDPGGETKYGISKRSYPDVDIKNLTVEQAIGIYYRDYWLKSHCDEMPHNIASAVIDSSINSGRKRAAVWLQQSVEHVELADDGVIGPITLKAVQDAPDAAVAARMYGHRLMMLTKLSTWNTYGKGWAKRIAEQLINMEDDK